MKYRFKKCSETDKTWLFDLHENTMREYVEKVYGWNPQRERAYFDVDVSFERYHLILNDQGEKVGAINYYHKNNVFKLNRIEVLPNYQNKGIGSAVLDMIIEQAKRENKIIELRVFKINPAHRLYSRKGFKAYKESDSHFYMRYGNG